MKEDAKEMFDSTKQQNKIMTMIKNNTEESVYNQKVEYTEKYKKLEKFCK